MQGSSEVNIRTIFIMFCGMGDNDGGGGGGGVEWGGGFIRTKGDSL